MRVNLLNHSITARHWSSVLMWLHESSPHKLYNHEFYQWLEKEWRIKVITSEEESAGYITAYEVDDSTYALLLLKFPLSEDN